MFPVERALLIINRLAGTSQSAAVTESLAAMFRQDLSKLSQVEVKCISTHSAARALTSQFLRQSDKPAFVVAGGGGGTLRAVIEGICDSYDCSMLPGPERVRVGALRMGSGNLLAKQFAVPCDPVLGLHGLLSSLKTGTTAPCCVMRCEVSNAAGQSEVHHAVTLGGFGQFGRIPSDLARWHSRFPALTKWAARLFGIEAFTDLEYLLAMLIRSLACVLFPQSCEMIDFSFSDRNERFRLLAGTMMNFPVKALPFKPHFSVEDESISVYLVPLEGRLSPLFQVFAPQRLISNTRCITLKKGQSLEIKLVDRTGVVFFLDEDPVTTYGRLTLEVAGALAFVPSPAYRPHTRPGISA
jgi:diacylglycerol kinase family enzyme